MGIRISTTFPTSFNDAAMCPEALVDAIANVSVTKTGASNPVTPGNLETFTIVVANEQISTVYDERRNPSRNYIVKQTGLI